MISMPDAYKQSMQEKRRNQSHMLVTIGVIHQEAQKDAKLDETEEIQYSYLSEPTKLFKNEEVEFLYVSMEENYFLADGGMLFPPRPENADYLFNQGAISRELFGAMAIRFGSIYDIRGLTVDFGPCYPVDFTVSNGKKTMSFTGNQKSHWTTEEIFDRTEYLIFRPIVMSGGQDRMRIQKILMGIGISFENKKIIQSMKTEYISPITEELPTLDFSVTVENNHRMFDVENKESAIHYLEIGQEVLVRYGYEVEDGGEITWMDGCVCRLSGWEADDNVMCFTARDKIECLEEIYYRGQYFPEGISLYALAEDVLGDVGVDERDYKLDQYLKKIIVNNPLPCVTHKECLQLIANAARGRLYTDRKGMICITAAFATVIRPERMLVESEDATPWSNLPSLVNGKEQIEYFTMSRDYARADGRMYFLPRSAPYLTAGFVSEEVADGKGYFTKNPEIKITLEAAMVYYGLKISFFGKAPLAFWIRTSYEGEKQEDFAVFGPWEGEAVITHEFLVFDTLVVEFSRARPDSRVFVRSVEFGDVTDYVMDYHGMTKSPKGIQTNKVAKVEVTRNLYSKSTEEKTIIQEDVDVTGKDWQIFYFSEPYFDVVVMVGNERLEVKESSCYFAKVDVSSLTGSHAFIVTGKAYLVVGKRYNRVLNSIGRIERWNNPLVSTEELAGWLADWLGNYFANNIEYEISYRGEPRLDAGDIVFLENKYIRNLQIQLYEHSLSFNGSLSGTVKARRAVNQENLNRTKQRS